MIRFIWFKVGEVAAYLGSSFMELDEKDHKRLVRFGPISLLWMIVVEVAITIFYICFLLFIWSEAVWKRHIRIWGPIRTPVRLLAGVAMLALGGLYWLAYWVIAGVSDGLVILTELRHRPRPA